MKKAILATCLAFMPTTCNAMNEFPNVYNTVDPDVSICPKAERYAIHIITATGSSFSAARLNLPNYNRNNYSVFLTCAHGFVDAMYDPFDEPSKFVMDMRMSNAIESKDLQTKAGTFTAEYEIAATEYREHIRYSVNNHDGMIYDYYRDTIDRQIMTDLRVDNHYLGIVNKNFITFRVPDLYLPFDIALSFGKQHVNDRTGFAINSSDLPEIWYLPELALHRNKPITIEAHGFPNCDVLREYKFSLQCELSKNGRWLKSRNQFTRKFIDKNVGMSGGPCYIVDAETNKKTLCGVLSGLYQRRLYIKTIPSQLIKLANSLR